MKIIGQHITRLLATLALVGTLSATLLSTTALAFAGTRISGAVHNTTAAPTPAGSHLPPCALLRATFTVQTAQGPAVFSPKRLVVFGTCFTQGASIAIWDYTASVSLTAGWTFVPADASARLTYTVQGAQCHHLLQVVVLDVAHNSRASGNGKTYGPCQPASTVFTS